MKQGLIIFLAMCAVATAMVAKERRDVSTEKSQQVCAKQTPCGWSIYKPGLKDIIELTLTNTYCICPADTICKIDEDDSTTSAFIHRCRVPGSSDDVTES